ncbi:MAG: glutamyl-tRNA reductase [Acidobacteriota bacterium]
MNLVVVGVSHKTAPVEIRERLAFPKLRLEQGLKELRERYQVDEGMILSTCNRVEVVAHIANGVDGVEHLTGFLNGFHELEVGFLNQFLYGYSRAEAVKHIFRVACSLDSMVIGEPQILGQVKSAFQIAQEAGTVGGTLNQVMGRAFFVAKRVRSETRIASAAVSISFAAVELAKKIFGELNGKTVLVMGAGKMSELAARHLTHSGVSQVLVWNRTYQRAVELAAVFQGQAILPEELFKHIERADIIISSTGSPTFILTRSDGERIIQLRRNRPVFIIDIAVPRDVDPEINKVTNIFLYDIDDLRNVIDANLKQRQREAQFAEEIVRQEVEAFVSQASYQSDLAPTIVSLRQHWDQIRREELTRAKKRLGELSAEQEAALESLTESLMNKLLHGPISELKQLSRQPARKDYVDSIKRILGLKER